MTSNSQYINLNRKIINCKKCRRLVTFRKKIAKDKRKMYQNETYWGKPIVGFGDENAKLLIIGLAPAAHGGNRTGRVFTGDKSSDFLFKCLNEVKISNQDRSDNINEIQATQNSDIGECFYFLWGTFRTAIILSDDQTTL